MMMHNVPTTPYDAAHIKNIIASTFHWLPFSQNIQQQKEEDEMIKKNAWQIAI